MSQLDSLPADQRAVLQLVLKQGQGYSEIAGLLGIEPSAVGDRAHRAVDALGPDLATELPSAQRALVADYLLGQQDAAGEQEAHDLLSSSAAARAWARGVSGELAPLARDPLPQIPEGIEAPAPEPIELADDPAAAFTDFDGDRGEPATTEPSGPPSQRSSRLGGVLLIAGVSILIAVGLVLIIRGGGNSDNGGAANAGTDTTATTNTSDTTTNPPTTTTGTTGTGTGTTTTTNPKVLFKVTMQTPGAPGAKAEADFIKQGTKNAVAVLGTGLPPTKVTNGQPADIYAVWLSNSTTDSQRLGFTTVPSNGQLSGLAPISGNPRRWKTVLVTLETQPDPKAPGRVILSGAIPKK